MRTAVLGFAATMALGACASSGAPREVNAVVQDETARQAAAASAQQGATSDTALEKAAEAKDASKAEPPL